MQLARAGGRAGVDEVRDAALGGDDPGAAGADDLGARAGRSAVP